MVITIHAESWQALTMGRTDLPLDPSTYTAIGHNSRFAGTTSSSDSRASEAQYRGEALLLRLEAAIQATTASGPFFARRRESPARQIQDHR